MTAYRILLISNGLLTSTRMTKEEAKAYIESHPKFPYKAASL